VNQKIRKKLRAISYNFIKLATNFSYFIPAKNKKIPILVYHRVCPLKYKKEVPYANVLPEQFDFQMNYLKNNFKIITVSEYLKKIQNNLILGNEACITFDDGYKDNYIYAFPILRKYFLRATFFLTTKYIGENTPFPWIIIDKGGKEDIYANRERWLPLSWNEVKEMMKYGMEFGTHTHTHRDSLSNMDKKEIEWEIKECTRIFKEKTGVYPELFSYPHGTFKDYNKTHIKLLKLYNYKGALTTNAGRNSVEQNPYELKRIIIYEEDSLWEFKKKVNGAYDIAGVLQKIWLKIAGAK